MNKHFIELLKYDFWATQQLLKTIEKYEVQDEKILFWLNHTYNAQMIWLKRIVGQQSHLTSNTMHDTEHLASFFMQVNSFLLGLLYNRKNENVPNLNTIIAYKNSKGISFENTMQSIFSHLLHHSTHHRGQICSQLRNLGIQPPPIDYIFYKRKQQSERH
ncbi:MAG: DinB family protein [Chitinophagales bacterium]